MIFIFGLEGTQPQTNTALLPTRRWNSTTMLATTIVYANDGNTHPQINSKTLTITSKFHLCNVMAVVVGI